ncbi:MAG: dienelactone hydrolase family protein [Nitrospinota bacterium]
MLVGTLYRPQGTGPFPAVVLLHGCGGLREYHTNWALWLKAEGYVSFLVDSFFTRGIDNVCSPSDFWKLSTGDRVWDAFGAVAYLRSLPFVNHNRIGVIGWSHGGMAALQAGSEGLGKVAQPGSGGFRAVVAFYPRCDGFLAADTIPLLLLLGELDDWTPSMPCVEGAKQLREDGRTVVWKVYPGAHHGFDNAALGARTINYFGHTIRYDPSATLDAKNRLRAFLEQHLRRSP